MCRYGDADDACSSTDGPESEQNNNEPMNSDNVTSDQETNKHWQTFT